MALFKKGSVYLPSQYRGIHLTCILSKTVERLIGGTLCRFLEMRGFSGKDNGKWITDPKTKADAFARTFASKSVLPDESQDCPFFGLPERELDVFISFRSRTCRRFLKALNTKKATGHDKVAATILKNLCDCLDVSFTLVCRRLFEEGCWPTIWRFHLVVPIFKRGAGAFLFRGTVEHRRLLMERFERGNEDVIQAELSAARQARSASSSWAVGAPKKARMPSPASRASVPS